jgi:MSHA biogenesis protein MshI
MLGKLKSLASARAPRGASNVGLCFNRALALAVTTSSGNTEVQVEELPTESTGQVEVLSRVVARFGLKGAEVSIALAPGNYTILQIERPPVEEEELLAAARWRVKSMLDYPVDEAVLQVFDTPQPNERQRSPMLNVVAAPARAVREVASVVRRAGLQPQKITIAELALRNLVSLHSSLPGPAIIVFLTARHGIIQVTNDDCIYLSRRLDYGLGSVKPVDVLATGIHSTLPLELRRTIDYFDSHFSAGSIRRVLAGPEEPTFMGFMRHAGEVIGLSVAPLPLRAELQRAQSRPADYGLPEAYLALGAALAPQDAGAAQRVAV